MIYPGDKHIFLLSLTKADGTLPTVTSTPRITVINAETDAVEVNNQVMTVISGTQLLYRYVWNTGAAAVGKYLAIVSYVADSVTINARLLESVQLGDSRILGIVALESTVAKEASVAKDLTVLKATDYIPPDSSVLVQAIANKMAMVPANLPTKDDIAELSTLVTDIHDCSIGTWSVDKQLNRLSLFRKNGTVLATFALTNNNAISARIRE